MTFFEQEYNILKNKLDSKQISGEEYSKELKLLILKEQTHKENGFINSDLKEALQYKHKTTLRSTKNYSYLFFFIICCYFLFLFIEGFFITKNYEYVDNISNLPEPIQEKTLGGTTFKIYGTPVKLSFIAEYDISGKVIASSSYLGYNVGNHLGPKDITLGWGPLSLQKNIDKISRYSLNNRFVFYFSNESLPPTFQTSYSNNHLIPSNYKIRRLISKIKKGDVVKIHGYLVNAFWGNGYTRLSSTTRTDSGDGACEVIYVTDISWLVEN